MTMFRRKQRQGEESIHHFSHKHELFFYYYVDGFSHISCVVCDSNISTDEEYLSCGSSCRFHMHKSCAELPQKLKHPFHPQHSLTLLEETPWRKGDCYCCACGELCTHFVYECSECEFYIDTKCVMLFPTTRLPAKHQKFCHPHPLFICERKIVEPHIFRYLSCGGCFVSFDGNYSSDDSEDSDDDKGEIDYSTLICVCLECHVLLHESCANLPKNITHHPLHPDCTLAFYTSTYNYSPRIICDFCRHKCRLYFQCSDCSIKIDIRCALLTPCTTTNLERPPVVEEVDIGHGNGHPHPLIHCNVHVNHCGLRNCSGCEERLEKSVYYCISCKLWLHESCAHLPHQIQHPFHPHHPLTLSDSTDDFRGKEFTCNSCRFERKRFAYLCRPCNFCLDLGCSSPPLYPMIYMPRLHKHPLAFSDINLSTPCRICKDDPNFHDDQHTFRCVQCEFVVHVICFPLLPPTVKALCHRHPLTLTRDPIGDPDGSVNYNNEVYYCDICENERSLISILNDPSYYCAECHLVSHVHCVISEVMNYLQEKSTSVEELLGGTKLLVFDETISDADMKNEDFDNLLSGVGKEIETVNTKLKEHRKECAELSSKLKQEEEICAEVSRKLRDLKGKRLQLIKDHLFHLQIKL